MRRLLLLALLTVPLALVADGIDIQVRLRMDELWKESCKWTVGDQKARSDRVRKELSEMPEVLTYLIEKLPEIDSTLEYRGVWGCLNPLGDRARPFYEAGLKHVDGKVRRSTLIMMEKSRVSLDEVLVGRIVELTVDDRLFGRVLTVLAKHENAAAMEHSLQRLQLAGSDRDILVAACDYVSRFKQGRIVPVLLNLLNHDSFIVRHAVIGALGRLGDTAQPAVSKLLTDASAVRRRQAVEILGLMKVDPLQLRPALIDPDRAVRATAARVLRELGESRETLERILSKHLDDPWIRGALSGESGD